MKNLGKNQGEIQPEQYPTRLDAIFLSAQRLHGSSIRKCAEVDSQVTTFCMMLLLFVFLY